MKSLGWVLSVLFLAGHGRLQAQPTPATGPLRLEFIADTPPTPSSHASTLVEASDGSLQVAWFGGTGEGKRDVVIWHSRLEGAAWSPPVVIARGEEDGDEPLPCWNPVLTQLKNGPLILFYKVGPSPASWWGRYRVSPDSGRTWGPSIRLPASYVGPVRNKPIELSDGRLLCGSSDESAGWRVHMETVRRLEVGRPVWSRTHELNSAMDFGAIQPTLIPWTQQRIQILCRSRQQVITECWSVDGGGTWTEMRKTALANPNSAIDAVLLRDGPAVLIHNPRAEGRNPLVASSSREGSDWRLDVTLENEPGAELSYPAIIQTSDGLIHVTYTWKREKIRHAVLAPAQFR